MQSMAATRVGDSIARVSAQDGHAQDLPPSKIDGAGGSGQRAALRALLARRPPRRAPQAREPRAAGPWSRRHYRSQIQTTSITLSVFYEMFVERSVAVHTVCRHLSYALTTMVCGSRSGPMKGMRREALRVACDKGSPPTCDNDLSVSMSGQLFQSPPGWKEQVCGSGPMFLYICLDSPRIVHKPSCFKPFRF